MSAARLRVVVATHLDASHVERMRELEPRLDVEWRPELMAPVGESTRGWQRPVAMRADYERYLDAAEALFGVPDHSGPALARTVAANAGLRWVHTIPAGGGAQVRAAGLVRADLERIAFTTSAGVHAGRLAEFALMGVLAGLKSYGRLRALQSRHEWSPPFEMRQVAGARVAVVGLGSIGRATAALLAAVGVHVVGVHRREVEVDGVAEIQPVERLEQVLAAVDAVVLALPETDATAGILGRQALESARQGMTVVNVGRGSAVDEAALLDALESGVVGTAVLDVTATEPLPASSGLWAHPGVLLSPHTAAVSGDQLAQIVELFADNATRLLDGRPLRNRVNIDEFY